MVVIDYFWWCIKMCQTATNSRVKADIDVDPDEALSVGEDGNPGPGDPEDVLTAREEVLYQAGDLVAVGPREGPTARPVVDLGVKLEP